MFSNLQAYPQIVTYLFKTSQMPTICIFLERLGTFLLTVTSGFSRQISHSLQFRAATLHRTIDVCLISVLSFQMIYNFALCLLVRYGISIPEDFSGLKSWRIAVVFFCASAEIHMNVG